jgi:hypothetical protein
MMGTGSDDVSFISATTPLNGSLKWLLAGVGLLAPTARLVR